MQNIIIFLEIETKSGKFQELKMTKNMENFDENS